MCLFCFSHYYDYCCYFPCYRRCSCLSPREFFFFFFYIKLVLKDVEIEGVKLALPNLHLCKQEPTWSVWGSDFPPCPSLTTHSTCGVSSWSEPVDWGAPSQRLSKSWFFWLQGFGSKAQEAPCARSKTPQWTLLPSVHQFTCRSGVLHEWEESVWFYFGTWIKHQKVSKVESTWIPSSSQCRSTPLLLFYIYIQKKNKKQLKPRKVNWPAQAPHWVGFTCQKINVH